MKKPHWMTLQMIHLHLRHLSDLTWGIKFHPLSKITYKCFRLIWFNIMTLRKHLTMRAECGCSRNRTTPWFSLLDYFLQLDFVSLLRHYSMNIHNYLWKHFSSPPWQLCVASMVTLWRHQWFRLRSLNDAYPSLAVVLFHTIGGLVTLAPTVSIIIWGLPLALPS